MVFSYLGGFNMTRDEVLIFRMLWDFMKDLPMNFDQANFSVIQCHDIIEAFMVKHGLKEEEVKLE